MIRSHLGRRKAKRPLNDVSPLDCDCREGRFLLRRIDEMSRMPEPTKEDSSFKRKLSKREKKQLKKQGWHSTRLPADNDYLWQSHAAGRWIILILKS